MSTSLTYQTNHVIDALNEGKLIGRIQSLEFALELIKSELDLAGSNLTAITWNVLNDRLQAAQKELEEFTGFSKEV